MPVTTLTANYTLPQTTIAVASTAGFLPAASFLINGSANTTLTSNYTLPASTIAVTSTTGFQTTGSLYINQNQVVQYTGISGNTFTGCTGGFGSVTSTESVAQFWSNPITYSGIAGNTFTGCSGGSGLVFSGNTVIEEFASPVNDLADSLLVDKYQPVLTINGTPYNTALIVYYKMRGYYVAGSTYETYVVSGCPTNIPPSGHTLIDVSIVSSWVDDKILVQ